MFEATIEEYLSNDYRYFSHSFEANALVRQFNLSITKELKFYKSRRVILIRTCSLHPHSCLYIFSDWFLIRRCISNELQNIILEYSTISQSDTKREREATKHLVI